MTQRDDDEGRQKTVHVDCRKLANLIGDYVDDQLETTTKEAFDEHTHQCAPCMAFLRQYRFAPEAARKVLLNQVPVELEDRLLSFLRKKCGK
jgi:anti-sigma factor RsiW